VERPLRLASLIRSDAQVFQFERAWAGILVASLLGISLYLAVVVAERVLVGWGAAIAGTRNPPEICSEIARKLTDRHQRDERGYVHEESAGS